VARIANAIFHTLQLHLHDLIHLVKGANDGKSHRVICTLSCCFTCKAVHLLHI
jgi:hypothetical protein